MLKFLFFFFFCPLLFCFFFFQNYYYKYCNKNKSIITIILAMHNLQNNKELERQPEKSFERSLDGAQRRESVMKDEENIQESDDLLEKQKEKEKNSTPFCLKWSVLLLLVIQTAGHALLLRYSRISQLSHGERRFLSSSAILVTEIVKLAISLFVFILAFIYYDNSGFGVCNSGQRAVRHLTEELFSQNMKLLALPGLLFLLQTQMIYMGISNLHITTFQVLQLLKILTTAFFSVAMLGTKLSKTQIAALFMLIVGVYVVQNAQDATVNQAINTTTTTTTTTAAQKTALERDNFQKAIGVLATVGATILSG